MIENYRNRVKIAKNYGNEGRVQIIKPFANYRIGAILKPHKDVARQWIRSGFAVPYDDSAPAPKRRGRPRANRD